MGSKNKIAEWVVSCLPPAEHFYDLFCGGCAVTHAAILAHRYHHYHVNDITDMGLLFRDIATGKRSVTYEWISREDFFKRKDTDPLVRTVWSFGNDNATYLYGKEVEPIKKAIHYAIVERVYTLTDELGMNLHSLNGVEGVYSRYIAYKHLLTNHPTSTEKKTPATAEHLQSLERIKRLATIAPPPEGDVNYSYLENIPRAYRVQSIAYSGLLEASQADYQDVEILPNSTVFCDIPYYNTHKYSKGGFDHERFYEWALTRDFPVFVTEYTMPDGFTPIAQKGRRGLMAANGKDGLKAEKVFVQTRYSNSYRRDLFV